MGKIAKMAKAMAKHCFKNMTLKNYKDPIINGYKFDVTTEILKRKIKKGTGPMARPC